MGSGGVRFLAPARSWLGQFCSGAFLLGPCCPPMLIIEAHFRVFSIVRVTMAACEWPPGTGQWQKGRLEFKFSLSQPPHANHSAICRRLSLDILSI